MTESFAAITPANSQRIVMNDNLGRVPPEEWICASGPKATWFCVVSYAKKHNIDVRDVGYACRPLKETK